MDAGQDHGQLAARFRSIARGLAAAALPALAAVLGPAAAHAATRDVWVAAVPQTWNAVPNARDAMHGTTFTRAQTTFPTVVYRRYTKDWRKPVTLAYERRAGAHSAHRPADPRARRRRAADPLQEPRHAARRAALDALPRRRVRALVRRDLPAAALRQGRRGDAGQDVHVQAHGRSRLGRRLALPRPLPVDGGVDRRRHVRRALDRRARRAAAGPRVPRRVRRLARLPDDRRPRVRRQHAGLRARRSGSASSGT